MKIDIEGMSLKDLKSLHAQLTKAISSFEDRRKQSALAELEEKARELGFSLGELTGTTVARKRTAVAPKYANPANPADTWSGRGRKPRWFAEAIASGTAAESMAV